MGDLSRLLIAVGTFLLLGGLLLALFTRLHLPLGRLPGDIVWRGRNTTVWVPLASSLVISILLSALLWIIQRLR